VAGEWLSLSQAADFLGVHPSTVRIWSNQGLLPVHRTQGGHRRFARSELELWLHSQNDQGLHGKAPRELRKATQSALRNTRLQISEGRLQEENWYRKLDEEARLQYRQSGRAMLQGMINTISNEETALAEAEALGYEYAMRGRRCGMESIEATQAFLFFRNLLMESVVGTFELAAVNNASTWGEMYQKVTAFTDKILLTILETYEVYQRSGN
jgi:excisionase family DNA binding protein